MLQIFFPLFIQDRGLILGQNLIGITAVQYIMGKLFCDLKELQGFSRLFLVFLSHLDFVKLLAVLVALVEYHFLLFNYVNNPSPFSLSFNT